MKTQFFSVLAGFAFALSSPLFGGQEVLLPLKEVVEKADVIWILEIVDVTEVTVPTKENSPGTVVQVSAAKRLETIKGEASTEGFALVSSRLPMSSAVWHSLPKGKYLGFLNLEQSHYRFPYNACLRKIGDDGKVDWLEKDDQGLWQPTRIALPEALEKVKAELKSRD